MDFDKIRPAAQEITLSKSDAEEIISSCTGKKRKFSFKPLIGVAAAAAVVTVVLTAPAFLFKASEADSKVSENINDFEFYYAADDTADSIVNQSASGITVDTPLFEAEGFADIYAIIPHEFASLVNSDEYAEWAGTVSAENGMAMVQFVEHFNISSEEFAAANAEYCTRISGSLADYPHSGGFDADIIFSSDREITDSFYSLQ